MKIFVKRRRYLNRFTHAFRVTCAFVFIKEPLSLRILSAISFRVIMYSQIDATATLIFWSHGGQV